jgi:hypothetical protein
MAWLKKAADKTMGDAVDESLKRKGRRPLGSAAACDSPRNADQCSAKRLDFCEIILILNNVGSVFREVTHVNHRPFLII